MSDSYKNNVLFANKNIIKNYMSIVDIASEFFTLTNNVREDHRKTLTPQQAKKKKVVSTLEHGSLLIYTKTNSFFWHKTKQGGDIFRFLNVMPEVKMSFYKAYQYLNDKMDYKNIDINEANKALKQQRETTKSVEKTEYIKTNEDIRKAESIIEYCSSQLLALERAKYLKGTLSVSVEILKNQKNRYDAANKLSHIHAQIVNSIETDKVIKNDLHLEKKYGTNQVTSKQVRAYLGYTRNIKWELVDELREKGCIIQEKRGRNRYAVFVNRNCYGLINGVNKRQCDLDQSDSYTTKFEDPNNTSKGWLLDYHNDGFYGGSGDPSKSLYVFESYIDMLSYISMRMDDGIDWHQDAYLSLGGSAKWNYVFDALDNTKYKNVYVGFDNDDSGHINAEKLMHELNDQNVENQRITSIGKDWNEDIVCIKKGTLKPRLTREIEDRKKKENELNGMEL